MAERAGTQTVPSLDASDALKSCCAAAYEHEWARLLLGDSLHPGGLALTERLGELLDLPAGATVLDVACGRGASAVHLARRFEWQVVGVDLGAANLKAASDAAAGAELSDRARFVRGDGERLPVADGVFDAVISECALCTMPDKPSAVAEFARVLRPGGVVGIADLTRGGELPAELSTLLGWVACVADARPLEDYVALLGDSGLEPRATERHDAALAALVGDVRKKLLGAEVMARLGRLPVDAADLAGYPGMRENLATAKRLARVAEGAVRDGTLGYGIVVATAPGRENR